MSAFVRPPKRYRVGTHRGRHPAETLALLQPRLAELGITRVADITGLDQIGIPTVMVTRPNSRSLSVSQGKGIDLAAAKVSGIMEALEQFHAESLELPLLLGSRADLAERGRQLVDTAALPGSGRELGEHDRILWVEGELRPSGGRVWVPHALVHFDLRLPLPPGSAFFALGSNGLASGNHELEATLHGAYELIERDALALFYADERGQWQRRLQLESVTEATCRELLVAYERAGIDVAVWEITSDIRVPAFLAMIRDRESNPFRPVGAAHGAGCHGDPNVALVRALTEAAQSRLTRIAGSRDDFSLAGFARAQSAEAEHRAVRQMATPASPPRRLSQAPACCSDDFETDLAILAEELSGCGVGPLISVDLSRRELPVAVVRVLIPGLEGVSEAPGYRPGARAQARQRLA
jgi:YcaO-like protein with predicted kinase domain